MFYGCESSGCLHPYVGCTGRAASATIATHLTQPVFSGGVYWCCVNPVSSARHVPVVIVQDMLGVLWNALADYYIRQGNFEKARDVYEEAIGTVMTVRDFSQVRSGDPFYIARSHNTAVAGSLTMQKHRNCCHTTPIPCMQLHQERCHQGRCSTESTSTDYNSRVIPETICIVI